MSLHDEEAAEKVVGSFSKTEKLLYELLLRGQTFGGISNHHDAKRLSQFIHNSLVGLRVLVKHTDGKHYRHDTGLSFFFDTLRMDVLKL